MTVRLQSEPFDPGAELNAFLARVEPTGGAVVSFTGTVRSDADNPIAAMTLEHYPALAQARLASLEAEARTRFGLLDALIIHRHGRLVPGEVIVLVLAAAPHRHAAFEAASFMMDTLKTTAPFWKKEERPDGTAAWVEARQSDDEAAARWRS